MADLSRAMRQMENVEAKEKTMGREVVSLGGESHVDNNNSS